MSGSSLRTILVCILGSAFATGAGCVSATRTDDIDPEAARVRARDDVRCDREYPTGSHIPRMVCRRAEHVEDRRSSDQQKMRDYQLGGAFVPPEPGN